MVEFQKTRCNFSAPRRPTHWHPPGCCSSRRFQSNLKICQLGTDGNWSKTVLLPRENLFSGTNRRLAVFLNCMANRIRNFQSPGSPHNFGLRPKKKTRQNPNMALSTRLHVSYNLWLKLGSKINCWRKYGNFNTYYNCKTFDQKSQKFLDAHFVTLCRHIRGRTGWL